MKNLLAEKYQVENDADIKQKFDDLSNNYQIKLSADDILNKYNEEVAAEKKQQKKFNKKYAIFGGLSSAVAISALTVGLVVGLNVNDHGGQQNIILTQSYQKSLARDVFSFTNFNFNDSQDSTKALIKMRNDFNQNAEKTAFEEVVNEYENIQKGIQTQFIFPNLNTTIETTENGYEFRGENFKYKMVSTDLSFTLYYNQDTRYEGSDEVLESLNGYYDYNGSVYKTHFINESENDEDETEIELQGIFINADDPNEPIKVIEKESETEENESEEKYSYSIYKDERALREDRFSYKVEYEFENDELEVMVEKENEKEIQFQHIRQLSPNKYTFEVEYESDELDDFDFRITLEYSQDYSVRTYTTTSGLKITKN